METSSFWNKSKPWFYAPLCNFIKNLRPRTIWGWAVVGNGRISVPHQLSKKKTRIALYRNRRDLGATWVDEVNRPGGWAERGRIE